jgi:hypothetical protein
MESFPKFTGLGLFLHDGPHPLPRAVNEMFNKLAMRLKEEKELAEQEKHSCS